IRFGATLQSASMQPRRLSGSRSISPRTEDGCEYTPRSADLADESVADEATGSLWAALVRPAPHSPQLLQPDIPYELTKSGGLTERSGKVPPHDVVHYIRSALEVMDDPHCPISVAENDARVENEVIRWQIIGGRQRTGALARISQGVDHELRGLRPDAAPL